MIKKKTVFFIYISLYNIYICIHTLCFLMGVARLKLSLCLMQKVLHLESLPKIVPGTRRLENCTVPLHTFPEAISVKFRQYL